MNTLTNEYIKNAGRIIDLILCNQDTSELNVDGRSGGYLTILDQQGLVETSQKIGEPNYNKAEKYREFSIEKAQRLFKNIDNGHITSFNSRNEKALKFAGAVHMYTPVISFSGFPELIDEAICWVVKLIICASTHRQDFHDNILKVYSVRPNNDGLKTYLKLQSYLYKHLQQKKPLDSSWNQIKTKKDLPKEEYDSVKVIDKENGKKHSYHFLFSISDYWMKNFSYWKKA